MYFIFPKMCPICEHRLSCYKHSWAISRLSDWKVWTLHTFKEFLYQQSRHKLNKLKYFATVHKIPRSLSIIGEGTFYEWFKSIFTMRDEDIEDSYGEDALQYLRFQRYVIGYLMFVMVICISVVLPLNFMGGLQGKI